MDHLTKEFQKVDINNDGKVIMVYNGFIWSLYPRSTLLSTKVFLDREVSALPRSKCKNFFMLLIGGLNSKIISFSLLTCVVMETVLCPKRSFKMNLVELTEQTELMI